MNQMIGKSLEMRNRYLWIVGYACHEAWFWDNHLVDAEGSAVPHGCLLTHFSEF